MKNGDKDILVKQARFLSALFESENGRPAANAAEMDHWIMSKTKEEREEIKKKLENYISKQT
jgi:hypothetical protein